MKLQPVLLLGLATLLPAGYASAQTTPTAPTAPAQTVPPASTATPVQAVPAPITTENYTCDKGREVRVMGGDQQEYRLHLSDQAPKVPVGGDKVTWYCGYDHREWDPPAGSAWMAVTRADDGSGTVQYFSAAK